MKRGPILIAVLEYGEVPELIRTAEILAALGRDIVFFFTKPNYWRLAQDGALVASKGFRWIDANGHPRPDVHLSRKTARSRNQSEPCDPPSPFVRQQARPKRKRTLIWPAGGLSIASTFAAHARTALTDVVNLCADFRRFRRRSRTIQQVVEQHSPSLVVLGQTAVASELDLVLLAARRLGCPSLIVPFAMFNLRELAIFALRRPAHHVSYGLLNRLLARLYPHWVIEFDGRRLLRLPGSRGLALEFAGLVHGLPWVPCSAPVTAIACESAASARQFEAMGVDAKRLSIVGGPVHDHLARHMAEGPAGRRRMLDDLGLRQELPILLCGWPANIFPWLRDNIIAFPNYSSLASAWADLLARARSDCRLNVIVSVHPKTLEEELEAARAAGLTVIRGDTERLIAHCDIFCTLNGSSITAWSIACRKPTVLYDCYETGYTEFDGVPGVIMTRSHPDFEQAISRVCTDTSLRAELVRKQDSMAADWGRLDGLSRDRLVTLAQQLLGESRGRDVAVAAART